jgi:hypothetical protein
VKTLAAAHAALALVGAAVAALLIAGCATPGGPLDPGAPIALPTSKELPPIGQQAQALMREAHLSIAAAAGVVAQNVGAGIWPPEQAQRYQDRLVDARKKLVDARKLLDAGSYDASLAQAKLLQSLLLELRRELAEEAANAEPQGGAK